MSTSRLSVGMAAGCLLCFVVVWSSWADTPRNAPSGSTTVTDFAPEPAAPAPANTGEADSFGFGAPVPTPVRSSRIMFESNWKNVQIGSKPMFFRQGDKAFVWTVRNTGENPVEVGDDYGFSIAPGEEDFIVDTRLMLSVAEDKSTTVEVKAARVMTHSELTQEARPTLVPNPGQTDSSFDKPADQFSPSPENPAGPSASKGGRKPDAPKPGSLFQSPEI